MPDSEPQKPKAPKPGHRGSYYRKLQIARLHVLGRTSEQIAAELGFKHPGSIRNLLMNEEVRALCEDVKRASRDQLLEDLRFAQHTAFRAMLELAVDAKAEKVRFDAAQHLLNMGGEPGKPTDKSESKSLSLSGPEGAAALIVNALRDPGVRALLDKNPELKGLLGDPTGTSSGSPESPASPGGTGPESV